MNSIKKNVYLFLLSFISYLFIIGGVEAQNSGNHIFNNESVHEVRIEFKENNFVEILTQNYESAEQGEIHGKVPYLMAKVIIDNESMDSIGVRYKGFTSYAQGVKKPIKLDFNEFVKGKRYDGLRKLNLNNATGDPSMQRDVLCYELLRSTGVSAPRTSYSKVYLNDTYWGLYQNIEQVDKTFIKENFDNAGGNLYKNKGWNNFEWLGTANDAYSPPYELKTNKSKNDWTGMVNLMSILHDSLNPDFATNIEEVFNVDLYLKTLAVDVATDNWDSNLAHGRNWYMYEDTVTGKFNWIPWDYNFAMEGGDITGGGDDCFLFSDFSFRVKERDTIVFSDRTFTFSEVTYLWDFGDGKSSTEKDPTHVYTTSGNYNVCLVVTDNDSCQDEKCNLVITTDISTPCPVIENGTCPHPEDLFFDAVVEWMPSCCDVWGDDCEELYQEIIDISDGPSRSRFTIDQRDSERKLIKQLLAVPEFNDRYYAYFCELMKYSMKEDFLFDIIDRNKELIMEEVKSDPNFLFDYTDFLNDIGDVSDTIGVKRFISDKIEQLKLEMDTIMTCDIDIVTSTVTWHDIVINEFVASNDSTSGISDPSGKYEDWVEIYNNTSSPIDMSEVFLSDKKSKLKEWQFPEGTIINSDSYLIVWADKDVEEEGLHTSFKLKKSGDELYLSNIDGSLIDSISFSEQSKNISFARRPNGSGDFVFQESSFGFNNNLVATLDKDKNLSINVFPNPAFNEMLVSVEGLTRADMNMKIFTSSGRLIVDQVVFTGAISINVGDWNIGLYVLQLIDDKGNITRKKFIVNH